MQRTGLACKFQNIFSPRSAAEPDTWLKLFFLVNSKPFRCVAEQTHLIWVAFVGIAAQVNQILLIGVGFWRIPKRFREQNIVDVSSGWLSKVRPNLDFPTTLGHFRRRYVQLPPLSRQRSGECHSGETGEKLSWFSALAWDSSNYFTLLTPCRPPPTQLTLRVLKSATI